MKSRTRRAAVVILLAAAAFVALGSGQAGAAKMHNTLALVGAGSPHVVEFSVCPRAEDGQAASDAYVPGGCPERVDGESTPYLAGETTLLVKLEKKLDPMLGVRFVPESSEAEDLLCGDQRRIYLNGARVRSDCSFEPIKAKGTKVIVLRLGFRLPAGEPMAAVAGSLVVGLGKRDEGDSVPLSGTYRALKEVAVNPTTLVLDEDDPEGKVRLIGPDVLELVRAMALGPSRVVLRADDGDTATVLVEFPSADAVAGQANPNLATGTVTLEGDPPPGKYTGKLPLAHASPSGPSVEIELHSDKPIWKMVLLVLAGIVSFGLAGRLVALATRRALLLQALAQSMAAYRCVRENDEPAAWDLAELLDGPPSGESGREKLGIQARASGTIHRWLDDYRSPYSGTRLHGLPALETSIKEARSSKDLDEDADRTLDMIARIQRWLRLEPPARLLAKLKANSDRNSPNPLEASVPAEQKDKKEGGDGASQRAKKERKKLDWKDSQVYLDTLAMVAMVEREPPDVGKADDLVARVLDQANLHSTFEALWWKGLDRTNIAASLIKLDEDMKGEKTTAGARTQEQRDALKARLQALSARHLTTEGELPPPDELEECPPDAGVADPGELGITPVDWKTSPNIFMGWATLDGASYGQLVRRTATSSKTVYRRGGFGRSLLIEAKTLRPADFVWTFAILSVSSLAYSATNYSDTWGDGQDIAQAFLAGAVGTATVKWGALPIFRSARIRSSKAK